MNAVIIPRMKVDAKSKTATIKDAMDCFSILVDCDASVKPKVSELQQKIQNSKLLSQTFIIVIGLITIVLIHFIYILITHFLNLLVFYRLLIFHLKFFKF